MVFRLNTAQAIGLLPFVATLVSAKFSIGVYDKTKIEAVGSSKVAPSWILCHPKTGGRWTLYAADVSAGCDYATHGDSADKWTFLVPGDRNLDVGEEISRFYLTGADSVSYTDKVTGVKKSRPVITYDSNIQNTFFSFGYNEGGYVDAPFSLVRGGKNTALSDSTAARNGDILDFVGIGGTKDAARLLRLQNFGGEGSYWHIGRGAALPLSKNTPIVEFRIIADPKSNKPWEESKSNRDYDFDETVANEYKIYDELLPEQGKLGTLGNIGKGLLSKLTKSIGKAGDKMAGGIKNYMTKPKGAVEETIVTEEDIIQPDESGQGRITPTFERFDIETVKKDKKGGN